jgi:hypothetical protein
VVPPTHAANDVFILLVNSELDPATPSGWTEVSGSMVTSTAGTTTSLLSVFWKRASSGAEANASITGCGKHGDAVILTYKNCITTGTPFDVLSTSTKASLTTATSITGVTATEACNDILYIAAHAGDNGATAQYSGATDANLVSVTELVDGS